MRKIAFFVAFVLSTVGISAQWTPVSTGTLAKLDAIHFIDDQTGYCAGGFTNALKTIDGGSTWTIGNSQGFRDFSFFNDTYGYGASIVSQSMAKTTNGGNNWTSIIPPTSNSLWGVSATSATTAYFVGTGGVVWKTTNSGASVSVLNSGTFDLITDVQFVNSTTGFIVVQTGTIKKTTNSGVTWNTVLTGQSGLLTEMHFVDENTGFVTGTNGLVLKTTDGGANWTTLTTNSTSYLQGVDFFDANHGIVVGLGGTILYTGDGGTSWAAQNSGTTRILYDVDLLTATSAVVTGDSGLVLKNTDIVLGLVEQQQAIVQLFPNPAIDFVTVQATELIQSIEVYDATGKRVFMVADVHEMSLEMSMESLQLGVYTVCIRTENGIAIEHLVK